VPETEFGADELGEVELMYPSRTRVVLPILKTDNACFDDQ
jgi:hypothetical protein